MPRGPGQAAVCGHYFGFSLIEKALTSEEKKIECVDAAVWLRWVDRFGAEIGRVVVGMA
ncbi:MAG TPA: hypothetical protein VH277_17915 [Gemmatimonadaceae bacterium]|nr:hypothetical protein [Gemmatimonadaceae bacterium]